MVADILAGLLPRGLQQSLLITLGNRLRSDDGVGPYLAERLSRVPGVRIENAGDRPERAIDYVHKYRPRHVVFLDAADFGGAPGTLRRIDRSEIVKRSLSTHRLPLSALIDWIEQESDAHCDCLGIQAATMQLGEELSSAVEKTAGEIIVWFKQLNNMDVAGL